jgi:hypothetical protein
MTALNQRRIRLAGTIGLLIAAIVLLPIVAARAGGERGGIGDQVKSSYGYSNYLAGEDPVTPCRSCYGGSGTDAQNLSTYEYGQTKRCESCVNGSWGR